MSWTGVLGYLPGGFGTASGATLTRSDGVQYTLQATGDYVTVAVSNVPAASAELVPNYMPLATYDSATNTISLLITPETSGVAMELLSDVIENYVRRDGAGSPTFYDGATVTLGAGATLEWNNNDGQISGVALLQGNNLTVQQIDTLSFGTGALSLSQASPGELQITGSSGSLYVSGPNLSSSTGDLRLEGNTIIATGDRLYIGDKTDPDTYYLHTTNGEIRMENSTGYASFKRTGDQLQIDTDASEIYLGKNLRVSRVYGTADHALTADNATNANYATSAGNANTVGGKTWSDIENYIKTQTQNESLSPLILTGSWIVQPYYPADYKKGWIVHGDHRKRYYGRPNYKAYPKWWSIDKDLGTTYFFPSLSKNPYPQHLQASIKAVKVGIYLGGTWESGSWAEVYERPIGSTSSGTLILKDSQPKGGSWRGKWVYFTMTPGKEYKIVADMPGMCYESYDDGYRVLMVASEVVYAVKLKQ